MSDRPRYEDRILRYLLGDLPEGERTAIEQEYFQQSERVEEIWAAENDLVDSYVRNRLSSADRALFERHYLDSPHHRERVAIARTLLEAADKSEEARASRMAHAGAEARTVAGKRDRSRSWWQRLATVQGLAPRLALTAAMLLLAAGLTWFWLERARLNEELAKANAELSEQERLEREAANQLAAEREKSERLRTEIDRLARRTSADPSDPASEPQKSILSFLLSPMLVRSGEGPQQISIPAGTDSVHLQMRVQNEAGQRFQVNLATVEGRQVWRGHATSPRGGGGQSETVSATIPAGKLGPGDYVLTLSAGKAGSLEEINRYFFRISR